MSVTFLTKAEAAAFGRYGGEPPAREVLDRFFFPDDADRELVARHRGDHHRLGFALALVTVRYPGRFLPDPLDVPTAVVGYVAVQVEWLTRRV
jgi:hypothetical protein